MIRVSDPKRLGRSLAEVRALLGMSRHGCAREIAALTGRTETSVHAQLWTWDVGRIEPSLSSLSAYLKVLGVRLVLDFEEEGSGPVVAAADPGVVADGRERRPQ